VITANAPRYLRPGGWLLLEHGYRQGGAVSTLLKQAGFCNVTTATDLAGRPRVSEGQFGASS
jgi:release factor glutamine methyltransferase